MNEVFYGNNNVRDNMSATEYAHPDVLVDTNWVISIARMPT